MKNLFFLAIVLVATLPSCAIADLKTDDLTDNRIGPGAEAKGRQLLKDAVMKSATPGDWRPTII